MSILSQIAAGAAKRNNGGGRSGTGGGSGGSWGSTSDIPRSQNVVQRGIGSAMSWLGNNARFSAGVMAPTLTQVNPGSVGTNIFHPQPFNIGQPLLNNLRPGFPFAPTPPAPAPRQPSFQIPGLPGSGTPLPYANQNAAYNAGLNAFTQNQVGNYDMALQRSQTGFALRGAGYDGVQNAINQSLGTDLQGVDLNRMTTEVNRQSNVGDIQDVNSQRRINEGMNATELGKLLTQENMLTDLYGQAGLTSTREQARVKQLERDEMDRSISEQSANGATSTVAARTNARLTGQQSDDEIAKIREGYTAEGTRFRASIADINSGRDSLNWDLRNSNLSLDQQARHLYDRDQLLSIEAARHNVDEQHLRNTANERLAQLGLDRAVSFGQLMEAQSSHDINVANAATQLFQGIAAYAASHPSA